MLGWSQSVLREMGCPYFPQEMDCEGWDTSSALMEPRLPEGNPRQPKVDRDRK